ncbi:MAG: hypothetical protein JRN11_08395 [Nitrososphaerota archaeon]|nr:hypothetical protein [Nitrososphaerota archaeon]MDG7012974.1 hypothetical protein [Nitrososphaerota archaeon]MDG7026754.1 hypothetical protein [Nitrososphaerota archaeon]
MSIVDGRYRYVGASPPGTVPRGLEPTDGQFISAIVGPRRAGKTAYMLQVMAGLPLPPSNKIFLNGEDVNLEGVAADQLDRVEETAFRVYRPDRALQIWLFIRPSPMTQSRFGVVASGWGRRDGPVYRTAHRVFGSGKSPRSEGFRPLTR